MLFEHCHVDCKQTGFLSTSIQSDYSGPSKLVSVQGVTFGFWQWEFADYIEDQSRNVCYRLTTVICHISVSGMATG